MFMNDPRLAEVISIDPAKQGLKRDEEMPSVKSPGGVISIDPAKQGLKLILAFCDFQRKW